MCCLFVTFEHGFMDIISQLRFNESCKLQGCFVNVITIVKSINWCDRSVYFAWRLNKKYGNGEKSWSNKTSLYDPLTLSLCIYSSPKIYVHLKLILYLYWMFLLLDFVCVTVANRKNFSFCHLRSIYISSIVRQILPTQNVERKKINLCHLLFQRWFYFSFIVSPWNKNTFY